MARVAMLRGRGDAIERCNEDRVDALIGAILE